MCWKGGLCRCFSFIILYPITFPCTPFQREWMCRCFTSWQMMKAKGSSRWKNTAHPLLTPAGCYKEWTVLRTGLICFFLIVFQPTPISLKAALLYALSLLLLSKLSSLLLDSAGQRGAWRVWGAWGAWARKGRRGERLVHCSKTRVIYLPSLFESSHQHAWGPGKVVS